MMTSTIDRTAWERTTHQQRALRALTEAISQDPTALQAAVRRAREDEFGSLDDLLLAAHAQWVRTFDARLDQLIEQGAYGDQPAVDDLWQRTARDLPGTAHLLDAHADHPAVVRMHARHSRRTGATMAVTLPSRWLPDRQSPSSTRSATLPGWARRARALLAH